MTSSVRSLSNFKDFPGRIDRERNLYVYPKLFKKAVSGKIREWQIFVRLIKTGSKNPKKTREVNWDLMVEDEVEIKKEYLDVGEKLPEGVIAQYFSETGFVGMKISRSAAVYTEDKNIDKANYRNAFQSALIETRAKYIKKIEEGSAEQSDNLSEEVKKLTVKENLYFPMLAHPWDKFESKTKYPVMVQPKLDGLRAVAFLNTSAGELDKSTWEDVRLYSRQKKDYPSNPSNDNIRKHLFEILKQNYDVEHDSSIYLDGELYLHGESLQSINSRTRGTDKNQRLDEYWVFDLFQCQHDTAPFYKRYELLKKIYQSLDKSAQEYIKLVDVYNIENKNELDAIYKKYLTEGYEGVIIRDPQGLYAKGEGKTSATRSKHLLKYKPLFDEEFEIVDYKSGDKGKEIGAIIFVLKTKDDKTFNAVPNMPYEERYSLYKQAQKNKGVGFIENFKGRLGKVEFRSISDDGIPLQPKFIGFRDYM